MNSENLISVVMSVYNSEKTVERSIESILNQTYQNIEFLIIDDASTDSTFLKCKSYSDKYQRIKLFRNEKNLGLTKSLNILINESKGLYIARQDGDDISKSSRISEQYNYLIKNKLDACSTRAEIIGSKKIIPWLTYFLPLNLTLKYKNPFVHGSLLIKKETLNRIGNYDENFYYSQDYKLMIDLVNQKNKISIIKKPLYELNMKDNISTNFKKEQQYFARCARKNLLP